MEELKIRQLWPARSRRKVISPWEASEDFAQDCWQACESIGACPSDRYYSFTLGTSEVVRMLIVDGRGPVDHSYRAPESIEGAVEIYFIETALGYRRSHLATQAIQLLRTDYPGRVFVAFQDTRQGFWESLDWHRCESTIPGHPTLFVSR